MANVPTILRGEDTAARGRTLAINLPEGDYTGLTIRLQWCGLERSWVSPASGASLTFDLSAADTLTLPLGTHMGRLGVVLADGTGYIISEDIRIRVTDDVAEATGEANAIHSSPADAAHALEINLDGIEDEPATPDALRAAWKELLARLRAAVGVALVCVGLASTARAEGRLVAQKAASGSLPWGAQVVTNVTIEGEMGLDAGAVTNIAKGVVSEATNGVATARYVDVSISEAVEGVVRLDAAGGIQVRGDVSSESGLHTEGDVTAGGVRVWDGNDYKSLGTAAYRDANEFATATDEALVYQLLTNRLSGVTFDFATVAGLYLAISNIVAAQGGAITNFPAIP